jgi:hypothetical protein
VETDQDDFLVLSGEALAIVEGQERPLQQWDLVHCKSCDRRRRQRSVCRSVAIRHGAGVEEETILAEVAYARFAAPVPTRYREGWLP